MKRYAGLDGIPGAWAIVWINGPERTFLRLDAISDLMTQPFDRAAIDIPIGIPDAGKRGCDVEAQALLGKNRNRVFTGVRRWMLEMPLRGPDDCDAINRRAWANGEKGISRQMFYILTKIREVDIVITPERQARLIECHPELVFQRLNGGRPVPSKKTALGLALRRDLLKADGFDLLDAWIDGRRGTGIRQDDLLDACACAIAARDSTQRVPPAPRTDPRGLRMEINY